MNIDFLNDELDLLSEKYFESKQQAWDNICSILEQQGVVTVLLPDEDTFYYKLKTDNETYYLYVDVENVIEEGVFATVLTSTEMDIWEQILIEDDRI
jgi:hypothetical protein